MRNARFWVFVNGGFVKLTIPTGIEYSWGRSTHGGEGPHHEAVRWEYHDGLVTEEYDEWGSDCDGKYESFVKRACHVTELTWDVALSGDAPDLPNWTVVDESRRDHSAERAGY